MSFFTEHELALACPPGCGTCGLYTGCRSPRMPYSGNGQAGILLVDSAPHSDDDSVGLHLQGDRTRLLREILTSRGINIDRDCWRTSAVCCRLPNDKTPSEEHIVACRSYLLQTIDKLRPKLVICLGEVAAGAITGHTFPPLHRGIDIVRGFTVPDQTIGTWVSFVFGLDYVAKTSFDPVVGVVWKHDITSALSMLNVPFPSYSHEGCIETTTDPQRAIYFLQKIINRRPVVSFDYEATGLKPHAKGQRILSCGIAVSPQKAVAFTVDNPDVLCLLAQILQDEHIVKVAHNAPFEMLWSDTKVAPVEGVIWDTCLLAHIDDCRRGVVGLDTQAYLRFGIAPWDTVESYKKGKNKQSGANAINTLSHVPLSQLLKYNAIDALCTRWLFDYYKEKGLIPC